MSQGPITIRRGQRTDFLLLPQLLELTVSPESEKAHVRHWRRVASNPTHDFYVAAREGGVHGMVLVSYIRALTTPGWRAILDLVIPVAALSEVGPLLLDCAKARARQRGCAHLMAWPTTQEQSKELSMLFRQAGFLPSGEVLSCALQ
jgi:predicted N-acetyltransferase YhbS